MDISKLSVTELNNLKTEIDREIAARKQKEKQQVMDQIKALAASKGYSLDELVSDRPLPASKGPKSPRKVAPKYVHPKDKSLTWTGRGKQPRWIKQLLEDGNSLASLVIR